MFEDQKSRSRIPKLDNLIFYPLNWNSFENFKVQETSVIYWGISKELIFVLKKKMIFLMINIERLITPQLYAKIDLY